MSGTITTRHRLEYALFRTVEAGLRLVPWTWTLRLGALLGRIAHLLDARHRRVARENLRLADLGLDEAEIRALSRACFDHFGAELLATIRMISLSKEALLERVTVDGLEHWDAAKAEGKGFIVVTGHYGSWEMVSLALSALGRPMAVIGRELDNPLMAPFLVRLRGRFGARVLSKAGAFRESLRALKAGECVGILMDQDALTNGIWVRFFGQWASTFPSAGLLAVKYNLPIVTLFGWPEGGGRSRVRIDPVIRASRTGDLDRDVWLTTQRLTQAIEAQVRRDPRYWFWMHRRFKTRPGVGHPQPPPLPPPEWVSLFATNQPGV